MCPKNKNTTKPRVTSQTRFPTQVRFTCTTPARFTGSRHPTGLASVHSFAPPSSSPVSFLQTSETSKNCRQAPCTVPPQRRHRYHRFSADPPPSHSPRQAAHSDGGGAGGGGGGEEPFPPPPLPPLTPLRGFRLFFTRWNSWGPMGRVRVPPPASGRSESKGSKTVLTWGESEKIRGPPYYVSSGAMILLYEKLRHSSVYGVHAAERGKFVCYRCSSA